MRVKCMNPDNVATFELCFNAPPSRASKTMLLTSPIYERANPTASASSIFSKLFPAHDGSTCAQIQQAAAVTVSPTARTSREFENQHAHALHSPFWWLKCAVGVSNAGHPAVAAYHKLLVWDLMRRPKVTRLAEALLNPLVGKSVVLYFTKPQATENQVPLGYSVASV